MGRVSGWVAWLISPAARSPSSSLTSRGRPGSSSSFASAMATCSESISACCGKPSRRTPARGRHARRLLLRGLLERARRAPRSGERSARASCPPLARRRRIRVRMGLHTGQAIASGGRYTGLAVHRAARIGAAGRGRADPRLQATQTLLDDEEEELNISLRDLGEQRLKDLDRPVRLYQADAEGLPAEFPPLRPGVEEKPERSFWRRPAAIAAAALARRRARRRGDRSSRPWRRGVCDRCCRTRWR